MKAPKTYHELQMAIGQHQAKQRGGGHIPTAVPLNGSDYIKFFEFWRKDHGDALKLIAGHIAQAQHANDALMYLDAKYGYMMPALNALEDGHYIDKLILAALDGDISKKDQETLFDLLVKLGE